MKPIERIFTDKNINFIIRVNPLHPFNPCPHKKSAI